MLTANPVLRILLLSATIVATEAVLGQNYPNKPIRIITGEAGGDSDFGARLVAQGISGPLGQPVVVENRPSSLSALIASKTSPDGYSLLVTGAGVYIATLLQHMDYDTVRDFSSVTLVSKQPNVLVVYPSLAAASLKDLIALAKAKPGQLNYSAGAVGGSPHLSVELLKAMAGVNIVRVPYNGGGPALNALLGGEVQLMMPTASSALPHIKSGKLRALAVTSLESSALVPGVPPIAASLPGYESVSMTTVFAPAKTPVAIINRLNQEIARFLKTTQAKQQFLNAGSETVGDSPQELAATVKSEIAKWTKVIQDAGLKID
jgi:tripartite-type tricarboxylate transporter receptor subunit TctC